MTSTSWALWTTTLMVTVHAAVGHAVGGRGWLLVVPMMLFNFGVAFWMIRVGQGGQRAVALEARQEVYGDATPDRAWKLGGGQQARPAAHGRYDAGADDYLPLVVLGAR